MQASFRIGGVLELESVSSHENPKHKSTAAISYPSLPSTLVAETLAVVMTIAKMAIIQAHAEHFD